MENVKILKPKTKIQFNLDGLLQNDDLFVEIVPASSKNARIKLKKKHTALHGAIKSFMKANGLSFRFKTNSAERDGVYGFLIVKKND